MEIVIGYQGKNHVTAGQVGRIMAGMAGSGTYVLETQNRLAATVVTANQVRVDTGDLVMQGRVATVETPETLTIESGVTGQKRRDLIVARYTMEASTAVEGIELRASAVSMGNPHFVTFTELTDAQIDMLGPVLERHPFFPRKTNVEFCWVEDGKIHIRVYERGAAWTLACGTGACASTTAAALTGRVPFGEPVDVELPGGWLRITIDKDLKYALMEGPAELVFEGEVS